jgi:hypothetical protein
MTQCGPHPARDWIAAGRLIKPEAYSLDSSEVKRAEELEHVDKMLVTDARALSAHGVPLTREQWLKEVKQCEDEGTPHICEVSPSATLEEDDHLATPRPPSRGRIGTPTRYSPTSCACFLTAESFDDVR